MRRPDDKGLLPIAAPSVGPLALASLLGVKDWLAKRYLIVEGVRGRVAINTGGTLLSLGS